MDDTTSTALIAKRTRSKIARRLLPFLCALYLVAYLDRANVAFAKLTMTADLHFSEAVFGFGAGIFFVGYLLLEIPGALIVERWGARRWFARILISWGLCTILVGFVRTASQFYGARFLLGVAEAGFYPGIIVYLTHWFARADRARATAGFIVAIPVSLMMGAPISAIILRIHWFDLAGWRWVFILEGLPAIVLGFTALFYMTDDPREAGWLEADERAWIMQELQVERQEKRAAGNIKLWSAFRDRRILLCALSICLANIGSYVFIFWLPTTIHKASGLSPVRSTLYSALPYAVAIGFVLLSGRSADRSGKLRLQTSVMMGLAGFFLILSAVPGQPFPLVMLWLCLTAGTIYAWPPPFWVLPTLMLGESAAAASIGFINMVGAIGAFLGPAIAGYLLSIGYGIELDSYRAAQASAVANQILQGSCLDVHCPAESFSLLYLNPPYDWSIGESRSQRVEPVFLAHTYRWLKPGGILVLVIPGERIGECSQTLTAQFRDTRFYRLSEPECVRYKQAVVLAVRRSRRERERLKDADITRALVQYANLASNAARLSVLPSEPEAQYLVPESGPVQLVHRGLPLDEIEDLLPRSAAYRQAGRILFAEQSSIIGRPLTPLHAGHVGLLACAGLLNGTFGSKENRHLSFWQSVKLLDKTEEEDEDGTITIRERESFSNELTLVFATGETAILK